MKVKFVTDKTDLFVLEKRIKVIVNNITLYTSLLESQIAFKLKLGSEKDYEDSAHLFEVFKDKFLDFEELEKYFIKYNVLSEARKVLQWKSLK